MRYLRFNRMSGALFILVCLIMALKWHYESRARIALGGDIEISSVQPVQTGSAAFLGMHSKERTYVTLSKIQARSVKDSSKTTLATLKSIEKKYPLYGKLEIKNRQRQPLLDRWRRKAPFGAVVNQALLDALDIKLGQRFSMGKKIYLANALLVQEPDHADNSEPRILVGKKGASSFIYRRHPNHKTMFYYRAILNQPYDLDALKSSFQQKFGTDVWSYRDWRDMVPWALRMLDWWLLAALAALSLLAAKMQRGFKTSRE